jgi:hypothetical protein
MTIGMQMIWLFVLSVPVACISWTITHEDLFLETRTYCIAKCHAAKSLFVRKFFYLFTCEYCFSHYVTVLIVLITGYKLLLNDWRGYLIAGFSLVWIANIYMSLFALIKIDVKKERTDTELKEKELSEK